MSNCFVKNFSIKNFLTIFIFIFLTVFIITSCEKRDHRTNLSPQKISIVTTLFPLYDFTREITKDKAEVILLLPPGIEPHSFNPKPSEIATIQRADIFIFTNIYMEPWALDILKGIDNKNLLVVDTSKGIEFIKVKDHHHHGDRVKISFDPHIWLDFSKALRMIDNIVEGLITKDQLNKDFYINNANLYKAKLKELDERFKETLSSCKKNILISSGHLSFSYFSKRYNLKYLSAYESLSPDTEPNPRQMLKIIKTMRQQGINHIFYEELIEPRIAKAIAKETGAQLLMLHAGHNISKDSFSSGETFISLMEKNLQNLKVALQCQ